MRRKDRETDRDFALYVIDKCEFATLSMSTPEGGVYCTPLSIVRDDEYIYFHSAQEGRKIECLRNNPSVCMSCVGDTLVEQDKFTTKYESATVEGTAVEVTDDNEKIHALKILCERYTPSNMHDFDNAINRSLFRTAIWKIHIDSVSGKCKK